MMPFERSILSLVIWRVIATTVVFSALLAAIIHINIGSTLLMLRDQTVHEQALNIASYLEKNDDTLTLDLPEAERGFYAAQGKMYQYIVRNLTGDVLFHSPIAFIDRFPITWPAEKHEFFEFTGPKGTAFIGVSIQHEFNGEAYLIQAAQSEESAEAFTKILATTFLTRMAWISIPFLLLLIGVIYFSIRKSLTPLQKASQQAREITFKTSDKRIDEIDIPSEILPLVRAINGALERLEKGAAGQKEFTANAAHELRTPLSILRSQVDMLEDRKIARKLAQDVDGMSRLVSQLLDIARLDFPDALPTETVDLTEILEKVCQDLWPVILREKHDLSLQTADEPVYAIGNSNAIYRALRNLLENAVAHTPAGTPIEVTQEVATIHIRDHGPGIQNEDMDKIFRRFWRKGTSSNSGSGLGLSIVKRIAELHQGDISAANHPEGGAIFTLRLPETPKTQA